MQQIKLTALFVGLSELRRASYGLAIDNLAMAQDNLTQLNTTALGLIGDLRSAGFHGLADQAVRFVRAIDDSAGIEWEHRVVQLNALAMDFHNALAEKLASTHFFRLMPAEDAYFFGRYFEPALKEHFPEAAFDLAEAGKSFALGRYTATVFHLMRVLEVALVAVHEDCGAEIPKSRNWGTLIQECEKAGADPGITERLRGIKDVWRNPSMHVEGKYTQEEADEVLAATRAFVRFLARHLSPNAPEPPSEQSPSGARD